MKEVALIDGDIVTYRCGAVSNNDPKEVAIWRVDDMMHRIMHETNSMSHQIFLTGSNNFRYDIYPEYKAHRKDKPKPIWLQELREHLVVNWKAKVTDGNEADDELGIAQCAGNGNTVICSIDKDLLQIPGYHYDFVKGLSRVVYPIDGLRTFYKQLITGDSSDNIPAFDGKFRTSLPKFVAKLCEPLDQMTDEKEMFKYCQDIWESDNSQIIINAKCLYIQKQENDQWQIP